MTLLALTQECERRGAPLTQGQLSRIERGEHAPRPNLRRVLADVLALDPLTLDRVDAADRA